MPNTYPKRLIEVDLPIARISAHARREKSIRHGHISTLHIWWARRPLAACRAVICAALWPDPADENCPPAFREAAVAAIKAFASRVFPPKITKELQGLQATASPESLARWEAIAAGTLTLDASQAADMPMLRMVLLDFIADFANWDNSTIPAYLETARALTQAAHEALGGEPGTRPLVVDPFAGGGSIPLEALRVGADAFASDLNPVAVLLNKVVLEYVPKYGNAEIRMKNAQDQEVMFHGLAEAVRYWGNWVKEQAENELGEFYPKDPDFSTPIAYLWARTILSEAPGQGAVPVEVPLIRSLWLCKKPNRKVALRWVRDKSGIVQTETVDVTYADGVTRTIRRPLLEIFEPKKESEVDPGTVARGSATCPVTGYTTPVDSVRAQLRPRRGGSTDGRLFIVVTIRDSESGRFYRLPTNFDLGVVAKGACLLAEQQARLGEDGIGVIPRELIGRNELRRISVPIYGMESWGDLFTPRQLLALTTIARLTYSIGDAQPHLDSDAAAALRTCLAFPINKLADKQSTFTGWKPTAEYMGGHTFARQALGMVLDWCEAGVFADASGAYASELEWVVEMLENAAKTVPDGAHASVAQSSATSHPLPDDSAMALVTDPPYYDAVPYAHLSDFFYVWMRRALSSSHPNLFAKSEVPKADEIVVDRPHRLSTSRKGVEFYERELTKAFGEGFR